MDGVRKNSDGTVTVKEQKRYLSCIKNDPWFKYDEIKTETALSRGTIEAIIHKHLKMKKLVSRLIPHELTEQNRKDRVRICIENLVKFDDGTWRLCDAVTGDESWFYWRQVGKKQSNKSWVAEGEKARTVVKIGRFESKNLFTIFFRTSGVVHISYLDKGKTINHQTYIKDCLKLLVSTLKEQRPM